MVVSENADTIHQAFDGATVKLLRSLDTMVGKSKDRSTINDFLLEEQSEDEE